MADVVISHARENGATARQLAEAVQRLGYEVWRPDQGSDAATADAVTDRIGEAKAVIVIWSDAASASEWIRAEANIARGMRKLVQASADGNPPPIPFDATQVSSISTWLGDDAHPGWEGVKSALASLVGPAPAAAPTPSADAPEPSIPIPAPVPEPTIQEPPLQEPPVQEPAIEEAPPPADEPKPLSDPEPALPAAAAAAKETLSAPARSKGPSGTLIVIVLIVFVALLVAGAWFWKRSRPPAPPAQENVAAPQPAAEAPAPGPALPSTEMPAAPANETFDRAAVLAGSDFAIVRSAPSQIGFTVARINPGEAFGTYQQSGDYWRVQTASGATGYLPAASIRLRPPGEAAAATPAEPGKATPPSRAERRAEPRQPRGPRIRKENSDVMAAFCEGAGRGTSQCRRFQRSTY